MKKTLFAATLLLAPAALTGAAHAQTLPPQNPLQVPTNPIGGRPGAIPLLGTGQNEIRGGQVVPINNTTGGTIRTVNGVIVPANGSYTPNPNRYGYGNTTNIIINNGYGYGYGTGYGYGYSNGVSYIGGGVGGQYTSSYSSGYGVGGPVSGFANGGYIGGSVLNSGSGYNGGYSIGYNPALARPRRDHGNRTIVGSNGNPVLRPIGPNPNLVLPGTPVRQTVTTGNVSTTTLFNGYAPVYSTGQTVLSPFGAAYGSPAYVSADYLVETPYPYLRGRETAVVSGVAPLTAFVGQTRPLYPAKPEAGGESASSSEATITGEKAELLRQALTDMQNFWLHDDPRALRRRTASGDTIAVYQNEKFAYSVKRNDFLALATDTLDKIQTRSLQFKRVAVRDDGLVNAYAAHTFRVPASVDQSVRTATVRVSFAWSGDDWFVSAVSFSPGSLK